MSKFAIRFGHQKTGRDIASPGEYDIIREYGPYVIEGLQLQGHEVLNVTPPDNNRTLADSLNWGISKANDWHADYFISLHVNSVGVVARGCEVVYGSDKGLVTAQRIVNELISLGFSKHQGAYKDQRGLAEIKNTTPIANIVEPFFVSDAIDLALYRKIGPKRLGYAIVKGLTGKEVPTVKPNTAKEEVKPMPKYDESIPTGEKIFNIPNTSFYIEEATDGRMIIHKDRGNYLVLGKGFVDAYVNDNNGHASNKRILGV